MTRPNRQDAYLCEKVCEEACVGRDLAHRQSRAERTASAARRVPSAVGVAPEFRFLDGIKGFQFAPAGMLIADDETLSTTVETVFAAGDAVTGPGSVAEAIGTGRRAAIGVECFRDAFLVTMVFSTYLVSLFCRESDACKSRTVTNEFVTADCHCRL